MKELYVSDVKSIRKFQVYELIVAMLYWICLTALYINKLTSLPNSPIFSPLNHSQSCKHENADSAPVFTINCSISPYRLIMSSCKFKFQFAVAFLLLCCTSNAHRILGLFPHPGVSHFHFFHPVMKALAEAGHDVTVVSQFPNKNPIENYRDEPIKSQHNLSNFVNLDVSIKAKINHFLVIQCATLNCSGSQIQSLTITC